MQQSWGKVTSSSAVELAGPKDKGGERSHAAGEVASYKGEGAEGKGQKASDKALWGPLGRSTWRGRRGVCSPGFRRPVKFLGQSLEV